jgi:hypothetical protein
MELCGCSHGGLTSVAGGTHSTDKCEDDDYTKDYPRNDICRQTECPQTRVGKLVARTIDEVGGVVCFAARLFAFVKQLDRAPNRQS